MSDRGDGSEVKFAWHLVEPSLEGAITSKEKLKYGRTSFHNHFKNTDTLTLFILSLFKTTALQCAGRNPSQSSIEKYWKNFGGK